MAETALSESKVEAEARKQKDEAEKARSIEQASLVTADNLVGSVVIQQCREVAEQEYK